MLDFSLRLRQGQFELDVDAKLTAPVVGIFGPSGSGKSSLLSCLAGLRSDAQGQVRCGDEVLQDTDRRVFVPPERRRLALMFQDYLLFPHMSVRQNLLFGYRTCPESERRFTPEPVIETLELEPLLEKRPGLLSGGEAQRVALGRSLLSSPRVLLLDEPLSSLDTRLRSRILSFLRDVRDELKTPILYVSHVVTEILELTDELLVLESGRKLGCGRYWKLVKDPRFIDLARELGLQNVIRAKVVEVDEEKSVTLAAVGDNVLRLSGRVAEPGDELHLGVRPEELILALEPVHGTSVQNQIPGRILDTWTAENRVMVQVDVGEVLLAEVSRQASTDLGLERDKVIYCLVKTQAIKILSVGKA